MFQRSLIIASLGLTSFGALAQPEFSLQLNDSAVKAEFQSSIDEEGEALLTGAYQYSEDDGSLINLGAFSRYVSPNGDYTLGAKYVGMALEDESNTHVLSLGGSYGVALAAGVEVSVSGFIAPGVLISGDYDRYMEADAKVSFQVMPRADLIVGYKTTRVDHEEGGHTYFDNSVYFGTTFKF